MLRTRIVTLAILFLLPGAGLAGAEAASSPPAPQSVFAGLSPGERIRLDVAGVRHEGPFERFVADTLWLRPAGSTTSIPLMADSIDALWERESSSGKGLVIGAVILGAVGLGLGLAVESDDYFDSESTNEPLLGLAMGAAGGAFLGGLIGAIIPHWDRKYP